LFSPEPCPTLQDGAFALLAKSKTENSCLFNASHEHHPGPHILGLPDFAVSSLTRYPVGTASASIRLAMLPNSLPRDMALGQHQPVVGYRGSMDRRTRLSCPVFWTACRCPT